MIRCAAFIATVLFTITFSLGAALSDYTDNRTIALAEADTKKIEVEAVSAWLIETMKGVAGVKPAEMAEAEKDANDALGHVKRWLNEFQKAGGGSIYVVAGFSNSRPDEGFSLVVPTGEGADGKAISALLISGRSDGPTVRRGNPEYVQKAEIVEGKGVFFGRPAAISTAKKIVPKERADVSAALGAVGNDAPLRGVFAPTQELRQTIGGIIPPVVFGEPSATLSKGLQWIGASFVPPPGVPKASMVIQMSDAAAAQSLGRIIAGGFAMMKITSKGQPDAPANVDEFIKLLTPTVTNDRLELSLDEAKLKSLAQQLAPLMRQQRQRAVQTASMSNMKQILVACTMYAAENNGEWPNDLDAIGKYLSDKDKALANPRNPQMKPAYVYIKPLAPKINPGTTAVLYESHTSFGNGVGVGFIDGHCEFVNQQQRFDELLQNAQGGGGGGL